MFECSDYEDYKFKLFSQIGKRECLGASLARQELLIFFVRLMQFFEVRPPFDDVKNLPDEKNALSRFQWVRIPKIFNVALISRS